MTERLLRGRILTLSPPCGGGSTCYPARPNRDPDSAIPSASAKPQ